MPYGRDCKECTSPAKPAEPMEIARVFELACLEPNFFRNTERARKALAIILARHFEGTEACQRFLLDYDVWNVGYSEDDPFPDVSPVEWLIVLGIDTKNSVAGIFDPAGVEDFEQRQLRRFVGLHEHHSMMNRNHADPQEALKAWRRLLDDWEREFQAHYGYSFRSK